MGPGLEALLARVAEQEAGNMAGRYAVGANPAFLDKVVLLSSGRANCARAAGAGGSGLLSEARGVPRGPGVGPAARASL
jgi:hypothetical protein